MGGAIGNVGGAFGNVGGAIGNVVVVVVVVGWWCRLVRERKGRKEWRWCGYVCAYLIWSGVGGG